MAAFLCDKGRRVTSKTAVEPKALESERREGQGGGQGQRGRARDSEQHTVPRHARQESSGGFLPSLWECSLSDAPFRKAPLCFEKLKPSGETVCRCSAPLGSPT